MGNNNCKQLGISPIHPITSQNFKDVWSAYVDKEDDHLGALTPETAKQFIFDFAEAIDIKCDEELAIRLVNTAQGRSKRVDGRISYTAFYDLFFNVAGVRSKFTDSFLQLSVSSPKSKSATSSIGSPASDRSSTASDTISTTSESSSVSSASPEGLAVSVGDGDESQSGPSRPLKILFFNVPLHGHMNPTLDLVAELVKQGHHVIYYTNESFRQKVLHTGAQEFRPYPASLDFKTTRSDTNIFRTAEEMLKAAVRLLETLAPDLTREHEQVGFDLIAYDVSAVWGKFLGHILDLPSVCCFPGLAPQWREYIRSKTIISRGLRDRIAGAEYVNSSDEMLSNIKSTYKIPPYLALSNLFSGSVLLNIVFTSRLFQPHSEYMTKSFVFVGPALFGGARQETVDFPWDRLVPSKSLVYVSMGTLYYQDPKFFTTCFEAFENSPYQVVISVGKGTKIEDLGKIPPNFIVRQYVPQPDLLSKAAVFVSHGGMGGISEAMHYGVPMLMLPKTIEQQLNARRIAVMGAGIDTRQSQNVEKSVLVEGVAKLLKEKAFAQNAKIIGDSFAQTGGVQPAIDALGEVPHYHAKQKITSPTVRLQNTLKMLQKQVDDTPKDGFSPKGAKGKEKQVIK